VVPFLKTYPFVKIWHAGCATGEEAYSMAILLNEEGMSGHYRMYATDINEAVLQRAAEGIVGLADMQRFTRNYQKSGGIGSFADYYTARYDRAVLSGTLKKGIVFAPHNLAADAEFGEMHVVLCRNTMIYFKPALKERCLRLFDSSLLSGGFLCVGLKETLEGKSVGSRYQELVPGLRIFRKRYG
jgi:chemotaxis protein methyltransferase CheR